MREIKTESVQDDQVLQQILQATIANIGNIIAIYVKCNEWYKIDNLRRFLDQIFNQVEVSRSNIKN